MGYRWRTRLFGSGVPMPRFAPAKAGAGTVALWILAVIAMFASASYAAPVLIPLCGAAVLYYLFAPLRRRFGRAGIGPVPFAFSMALLLAGLLLAGFSVLAAPVSGLVDKAPSMILRVQEKIGSIMRPVEKMREVTDKVEKIAKPEGQASPPEVALHRRGLIDRVFGGLSDFVVNIGATLMLFFYLLVRPAAPERAFIGFFGSLGARRRVYRAVRQAEADLGRYMATIAGINAALGVILAIAFHFIGLPDAAVLGAAIALLNFVPFLGAAASVVLVFIAGLASFDSLPYALIAPGVAAGVHVVEANFVTPAVLGRRLTLDPFLVVLALLIGGWLWGIGGALLAVPMLLFTVTAWRAYVAAKAPAPTEAPAATPAPSAPATLSAPA